LAADSTLPLAKADQRQMARQARREERRAKRGTRERGVVGDF
jgi:hypothetical protein